MSSSFKYEGLFDKCLDLLSEKFEEIAAKGEDCDLAQWLQLFAYDAINQITLGESPGGLETGHDSSGIHKAATYSAYYGAIVGVIPEFHSWLWKLMPSTGGEKEARNFVQIQLERKRQVHQNGNVSKSLVDQWMEQHKTDVEKMSLKDIRVGIAANLGAGADTTAYVICAVIFSLCKHPDVMKKLQSELDTAITQHPSNNGIIRYDDARELSYLAVVIKETLRLYPVLGVLMLRRVPQGGATLAGHFFREGLNVGLNQWATRTNPKYFGEDAAEFRPDRWLGPEEEVKRLDYYHIPVRTCS